MKSFVLNFLWYPNSLFGRLETKTALIYETVTFKIGYLKGIPELMSKILGKLLVVVPSTNTKAEF